MGRGPTPEVIHLGFRPPEMDVAPAEGVLGRFVHSFCDVPAGPEFLRKPVP
jgi:hypothetical protein